MDLPSSHGVSESRPQNLGEASESRRRALLTNNHRKISKGRVRLSSQQESPEEPMMHLMPFVSRHYQKRALGLRKGTARKQHYWPLKCQQESFTAETYQELYATFPRSIPIACSVRSRRSNPMFCSLFGKTITVTSIAKRSA